MCTGVSVPSCLFNLTVNLEGGDAASLERLSASTDYHQRRSATQQHTATQRDRQQARVLYGTQPETHLRVVPIKGDGRCLFRALVSMTPRLLLMAQHQFMPRMHNMPMCSLTHGTGSHVVR